MKQDRLLFVHARQRRPTSFVTGPELEWPDAVRALVLIASVAACSEPPLQAQPLPPLQANARARSITDVEVALWPGESMSWNVRWRGLKIGVAELEVTGLAKSARVHSHFRATGFAAEARPTEHHLSTDLPAGLERRDDLHSALGRLRAWARPGAEPAAIDVVHQGRVYRVRFATPAIERPLGAAETLRVDGEARSRGSVIELTVWLSTDRDRVPLFANVDVDGKRVRAELIDYSRGR